MLPPGWARVWTKPWLTGSVTTANTIGVVAVRWRSSSTEGVPSASRMSGLSAISSSASRAMRARSPAPLRQSIDKLSCSFQPWTASASARRACPITSSAAVTESTPSRRVPFGYCARAEAGSAAIVPRSAKRSRRFMGCPSDPALKLAQHQRADHVHAGCAVVETGYRGKLLAAIVLENLGILLRDLLQRLQAVSGKARRHHRDAAHALLGQTLHRLVGVGLKPLVIAEARLEGQQQLCLLHVEPAAQRLGGGDALALIRIALFDIGFRHAVKGGDDQLRLEGQRGQMRLDRGAERLDIRLIFIVRRCYPQRRLRPETGEHAKHLVADGRRSRGGILRIEGNGENAVAALRDQRIDTRLDRRIAVAHRPIHDDLPAVRQRGREFVAL